PLRRPSRARACGGAEKTGETGSAFAGRRRQGGPAVEIETMPNLFILSTAFILALMFGLLDFLVQTA
ncbi:MAG: hypothetical protein D6788_00505, partial [Planctomycetota bacterium]